MRPCNGADEPMCVRLPSIQILGFRQNAQPSGTHLITERAGIAGFSKTVAQCAEKLQPLRTFVGQLEKAVFFDVAIHEDKPGPELPAIKLPVTVAAPTFSTSE
jgi:hypothetical protein